MAMLFIDNRLARQQRPNQLAFQFIEKTQPDQENY
jgi:hypothetical protein